MTLQRASNVLAAIKRETTLGTAATAGSATQMRITDSPGLELKRTPVQSKEKRSDGLTNRPRLAGKMVDGSFNAEATIGGATDILFEAIMRGTWTAAVAITQATFTSITTPTSSTIVAAAGSWITAGVRAGDIVTITGQDAGNEGLRVRVITVTALTLTVAGTPLTVNAVADTSCTVTILKKLINPTTPTHYSHTIEQYDQDIDLTELFLGLRLVGLKLSCKPNSTADITYTFQGMDRTLLVTGTSPWFTSPSLTTGPALIADDASLLQAGVVVTSFTSLELDFKINAKGEPVLGSLVQPDIFDNDFTIEGTVTGLRSDFANPILFDAETTFSLGIMLQEPGSAPRATLGIWLPVVQLGSVSAPFGGGDGGKTETRTLLIGPQSSAATLDATLAIIHSSAA